MQCPITNKIWQRAQETGDPVVARHLASCDICRTEASRFACLQDALGALPELEVPQQLMTKAHDLAQQTQGQALSCAETRQWLEPWREGDLDAVRAFLVEDHLLWCDACTEELARAERLTVILGMLPGVEAPATIAERIAAARVPWWQRLLPAPAPSWSRQFALAASLAAGFMLMVGSTLLTPRMALTPVETGTKQALIIPVVPPHPTDEIPGSIPLISVVPSVSHTTTHVNENAGQRINTSSPKPEPTQIATIPMAAPPLPVKPDRGVRSNGRAIPEGTAPANVVPENADTDNQPDNTIALVSNASASDYMKREKEAEDRTKTEEDLSNPKFSSASLGHGG